MRLLRRFCVLTLGLAMALAMTSVVRADAVTDWNAIAIQAIVNVTVVPPHGSAIGFLDSATVQTAVYDAVESITGRFRPYAVQVPGASGSPAAAVAKAAHDVLVNRFPSQTMFLDTTYHAYLTAHGLAETDAGVAVGAAAAAGIIALRANDGSFPLNPPPFTGGTAIGEWRPTPPAFAPMLAPWLASVTPFTLTSPSQFRAPTPPSLTSNRYATAYNEVKALGARDNSARTPEQTDLALFWSSNYLVLWNHALRDIAAAHVPDISDSARLFALANLAMADAGITAWDTKVHYVFWRPLTAIQNGDNDGNPDRLHLRGQQRHWRRNSHACPLLRDRRNGLLRGHYQPPAGDPADAHIYPVPRCRRGCGQRPHLRGHPLPLCGRAGAEAGAPRGPVGLLPFPTLG